MEVKQVAAFVNSAISEALGTAALQSENLADIVDAGKAVLQSDQALEKYTKALVNRIGREIYVSRQYQGMVPSILRDSWEYGSILMKVSGALPEVEENVMWEIGDKDGQTVSPFWVKLPTGVRVRFYNNRITFRLKQTLVTRQIKQSFTSAAAMQSYTNMLEDLIKKSMTIAIDELIMRGINNMIAHTVKTDSTAQLRAINLLGWYKSLYPESLITADSCIYDGDFIRFAVYQIKRLSKKLTKISTLYNVAKQPRFTPTEYQRLILLQDFASAAEVFLYDAKGQLRNEYLTLPVTDTVPYWQGSGQSDDFSDCAMVKTSETANTDGAVTVKGVLGVLMDRDAVAIACLEESTRTLYNPEVDGVNMWYDTTMGILNDDAENFLVFFASDSAGVMTLEEPPIIETDTEPEAAPAKASTKKAKS